MKKDIVFILLLMVSSVCPAQNLVSNPGLEVWEKPTRPSGWNHVEKCTKDSAEVHSGRYSCKHSGGTSTTSDLAQSIPVSAGIDYTLSLFYKTGTPSDGKGSRIWCYWKDPENNSISDPETDPVMRPSEYLESSVWRQFSINVRAPAGAVAFWLEVRTNSNSLMYWDDFVFGETVIVSAPGPENAVAEVFPLPANDAITLRNIGGSDRAELIDHMGNIILTTDTRGMNETHLHMTGFKKGIYFLRVHYPGRITVLKVVKE